MKKKKIALIIIFLMGISLLLYPRIGNIITSYKQNKIIENYKEIVNVNNEEKNKEIYEEAVKYNEKIYSYRNIKKRYNFADEYKNILKLNNSEIIGYIEIPKVKIKLPIYHDVDDDVLQLGVGHVKESSLPIGTTNQNSLLMGHSGLPISKIFTNLEILKENDFIEIIILDKKLYYKVTNKEVVEPRQVYDKMKIVEGKDLITLVTCTPYGVNSHRLVITAERTDEVPKDKDLTVNPEIYYKNINLVIVVVLITLLLGGLYLYRKNKDKQKVQPEENIIAITNIKEAKEEKDDKNKQSTLNSVNKKKKKNNNQKKKKRKRKKKNNSKKK